MALIKYSEAPQKKNGKNNLTYFSLSVRNQDEKGQREYSLVIRQKGKSQNECFKKTKHARFSEKRTFLTPWYAHVGGRIRGVRNVRFSENLACFVFLKHPFWDSPFCLNTDEISSSVFINPFHTTGVFPYLLKISEYVRGSPDIFGEYMMRPVFWNKLNEDKSQILNTSLASESNKTNARRKE